MTLENFKLAVLSGEFTDEEIKKLFLDVEIPGEADIREVVGVLERHRPNVLRDLSNLLLTKKP